LILRDSLWLIGGMILICRHFACKTASVSVCLSVCLCVWACTRCDSQKCCMLDRTWKTHLITVLSVSSLRHATPHRRSVAVALCLCVFLSVCLLLQSLKPGFHSNTRNASTATHALHARVRFCALRFVRGNVRTIVHHRAETLRTEKIGALSDPACVASVASVACDACVALRVFEWKPSFTLHLSPVSTTQVDGPSERPELTGDRFPLTVNTGRVDGRAFPLAELTSRQLG